MESGNTVTITAFRATEHPETCRLYQFEHRQVLTDLGVSAAIPEDDSWTRSPDTVVVVAEHTGLGMVGGIRIQRRRPDSPMPMEKAIRDLEPRLDEFIAPYDMQGCGEVCGLWNANRFAGKGIPLLLSMAAVSLANQAGLGSLFCFVAHYTLRHALKVGFTIMEDVGDGGSFSYPIPGIKSFAMVIPDTLVLGASPFNHRSSVISLRCRPEQDRIEAPTGVPYAVRYRLLLGSAQAEREIYAAIAMQHLEQRA